MAVREVLTFPDPRLKRKSPVVETIDDAVRKVIADLTETLDASAGCVGIAAPQIGELYRLIVIDASRGRKPCENHGFMVLINPEILETSGDVLGREGCLSIPSLTANVRRPQRLKVRALNPQGETVEFECTDFEARLVAHENDHLDGILFLDRVGSLKSDVFRRKTAREAIKQATGSFPKQEV